MTLSSEERDGIVCLLSEYVVLRSECRCDVGPAGTTCDRCWSEKYIAVLTREQGRAANVTLEDVMHEELDREQADQLPVGTIRRVRSTVQTLGRELKAMAHSAEMLVGAIDEDLAAVRQIEADRDPTPGPSVDLPEVLRLIEQDPHQWSSRPCATCVCVSRLAGRPFGCNTRKASR